MNVLVLSGRLTKNFELNNNVAKSSIAVETYNGGTMFVDLSVFKKSADYCVKYCRKGDLVVVEGELNIFKKDDKVYTSCVVKTIQNCSGKKRKQGDDIYLEKDNVIADEAEVNIDDDSSLPF